MFGMRELGYVSGTNLVIDWRFADGRYVRIPGFVEEFARLKVDVIFLGSPATVNPVREATRTIPIVMGYSSDPVGNGFVASLERPGGNVTGLANPSANISARQLDILKLAVPGLSRVALLQNPDSSLYAHVLATTRSAAQKAGLEVVATDARDLEDIEGALAALRGDRVGGVMVAADEYFLRYHRQIAELMLTHRLPSIFQERDYVDAGGLLSYGESLKEFYRRAASFVDRIFMGAKPADLPIEQPTRLHLVINRKTANALGMTIPAQLYSIADDVIQ
ncbi:MAG: hypothetical protein QOI12_4194 [Alphaproteobacteria bacterium]|jgi:putative ABC transport system substrate-binding protein|nr:hypothetical protein [Alphaproteobacteria bacterium]